MVDKVDKKEYNVPLRKGYLKAPPYRRTKRAISELKTFLLKHLKVKEVKLGKKLNLKMWENGIQNPPHHVKVVGFVENGVGKAELAGFDYSESTLKEKEEKAEKSQKSDKKTAEKKSSKIVDAEAVKEEIEEEVEEAADEIISEEKAEKPKKRAPAKKKKEE